RGGGRPWEVDAFLFSAATPALTLNWEHVEYAWVAPPDLAAYDCLPWLRASTTPSRPTASTPPARTAARSQVPRRSVPPAAPPTRTPPACWRSPARRRRAPGAR